jgi:hypothetical protein
MGGIEGFYFPDGRPPCKLKRMNSERERVISVCLSEAEWRAFVTRHPQPVSWLRERILAEVQAVVVLAEVREAVSRATSSSV